MVTVERIRDDSEKRILRCSEGNRVWYQMWIDPGDMLRIEPLLEGGSRTWMIELQKYYVFFYERKKGRRLIGKDRVKKILDTLYKGEPGMFGLWLLCVKYMGLYYNPI